MKRFLPLASAALFTVGCGNGVQSEDTARIAFIGLDDVVERSLSLGFAGFNAASSANIPAQSADGALSGTLQVNGQVDQGASDNKGMRLTAALEDYADRLVDDPETEEEEAFDVVYATTDDAPLALGVDLRNIPTGTHEGTLTGTVVMNGDLAGEVDVSIAYSGTLEDDGAGGTQRKSGATVATGTVESGDSTFDVDITF
jgi:hypothetical protein